MNTDPRTDQQLIAAINAGDDDAFDVLYFRYRNFVLRLAKRWTGNDADALDVAQDAFLYLAEKFPGFRLTCAMTSFLYPVVRNLSIAARKRSQRFAGDESLDALPSETTSSDDDLSAMLRHLSATHREIVLMRFVDDLPLQEIADALKVPLGTVKSRLHHAIETMRNDDRTRKYFQS